ncbi:hypothetical protein LX16_1355 [Stackebrandtia albiflava]|uniref:YCII-related domain-containing protein n=1 Tax=Stackebrandtia albiflava TaxID=406432 RepID=A0A562VCN6_9ACTN|nr:YciI family protein [Stackebrandtia albiflava]TWJ15644.1 hypothetical protein LX16_1355 [Stackebrandtia albiflava]
MRFLVIGRDGTDPEAPDRRAAARQAHLAAGSRLAEEGVLVHGGALVDDDGRMTGSMLLLDLPDRAALDAWLAEEPYVTGDVWREVTVERFQPGPWHLPA